MDVTRWSLTPHQPIRRDCAGEIAHLAEWIATMGGRDQVHDDYFVENETSNYPLVAVTGYPPSQRASRLMTSLVTWLGSPNGSNFAAEAAKADFGRHGDKRHAMSWALINQPGRTPAPRTMLLQPVSQAPGLTDIATMERLMAWLDEPDGAAFMARAAKRRERLRKALAPPRPFDHREALRVQAAIDEIGKDPLVPFCGALVAKREGRIGIPAHDVDRLRLIRDRVDMPLVVTVDGDDYASLESLIRAGFEPEDDIGGLGWLDRQHDYGRLVVESKNGRKLEPVSLALGETGLTGAKTCVP